MSQKIYIVEDEPDIRETLKYNFSNEGFKVFTAPDGEEALSNIKKVLPDVLILDLMLPGVSGLDVCKSIRADDDIRDMSIIISTRVDRKQIRRLSRPLWMWYWWI